MQRYKIADVVIELFSLYNFTHKLCENYLYDGDEKTELEIIISQQDIDREKNQFAVKERAPDQYLECLAVYRKLCNYLLEKGDGLIFHSSALAVDGKAYLFTAPSGTGKSTHARYWREYLGDKVTMINDDKPIIRYIDGEFYVYGTPWNGKHRIDNNVKIKLGAICSIYRANENQIRQATSKEMLSVILNQTLRSDKIEIMDRLFLLIGKMLEKVKVYKLGCNMSVDAAKVAYEFMREEI